MRFPPISTVFFFFLLMLGASVPARSGPIEVFSLQLNYNYGRFQFGDWGYQLDVSFPASDDVSWGLPGVDDLHFEYTAGSDSLVRVAERHPAHNSSLTEHEYLFGRGRVDLTFDYMLNGVREHGSFTGALGRFTTVVSEHDNAASSIFFGAANVLDGVFDSRTAELFGLPQAISGGRMELDFDNERRLLGQYGDDVREAAAYGGPLTLTVPEPSVSALLLVAASCAAWIRRRSFLP